jgi:hypothetical protein
MGSEQLLPHLLVINLLLLFLQKGERLFVANSMPILLKHIILRSLVLMLLRSMALGPRPLPPRTLSRRKGTTATSFHPCGREVKSILNQWEKRTSDPWILSIIRGD